MSPPRSTIFALSSGRPAGGDAQRYLFSKAKKECDVLIKAKNVVGVQSANSSAGFGFWQGRNLVDHRLRGKLQAVQLGWSYGKTCWRCVNQDAGEQAYGHRWGGIEFVALENNRRARLTGIVGAARNGPDFAALQSDCPSVRHHGVGGSLFSKAAASGEFHQETESSHA